MRPFFALLPLSLFVCACSGAYWPDAYSYPAGYTYHDITPVSSPHGYDKTPAQETALRGDIAKNAQAWRDGIATVITPLLSGMDMNTPVAVVTGSGFSPLNASAANYTRDLLVAMSYLTALPGQTDQVLVLSAEPEAKAGPDQVHLTLILQRSGAELARHDGVFAVPAQSVENNHLPGFSPFPSAGPVNDSVPFRVNP